MVKAERKFKCIEEELMEPGEAGRIAEGCKELKESGRELKGAYGVGRSFQCDRRPLPAKASDLRFVGRFQRCNPRD